MRKKLIILLFVIPCFCFQSYAQLEADHWMFNPMAYVSFKRGSYPDTVHYPNNLSFLTPSGTVSYSDKNGNLLFYGGGGLIYDKNFTVFPSLQPSFFEPLESTISGVFSSQTMLGIPYPGRDSFYIIFHIKCDFLNNLKPQLFYSIVNMKLRNGLGEIEPGQKNIPLLNGVEVGFKLTSVLHCNKKDIWIIGHLANSNQYFSLLVTSTGISAPQYFTGNFIPYRNRAGCVKVSALGNRLAAAYADTTLVELMDFNTQTGLGSNMKTLTAMPIPSQIYHNPNHSGLGSFGVDFSPTGNKLYVTSNYELQILPGVWHGFIYQFDASLPTTAQIQASQFKIDSIRQQVAGAIQIGNNGRMYINVQDELFEIAYPENTGTACGYTPHAVRSGFQYSNHNLPIFLQSYFRYPIIATGNCQFQNVSFSIQNPIGVSSILWNFGDPASGANNSSTSFTPTHIYSSQGVYTATAILTNSNGCGVDTIRKVVHAGPFRVFLGNDTTICEGDTLELKIKIPGAYNTWSNRSNDTTIKVTQAGTYWVRVNLGECFTTDTINVAVRQLPLFSLGSDTTICNNQAITLAPNPVPLSTSYLWNNGSPAQNILVNTNGIYWLELTDNYSCSYRDSIQIDYKSLPEFSLGEDTTLCQSLLQLNAAVAGAAGYLWSNGATTTSINVNQSGIYWADVTRDNCTYRDSITITFTPYPVVDFGNDTTLCEGTTMILDAQNPGSVYEWHNNSTNQLLTVDKAGRYFVKVTSNGCSSSDTINVSYDLKPVFTLGTDRLICGGQIITLQPSIQNGQGIIYLWQDGSRGTTYNVTAPGNYFLQLSNICGSKADSVIVSKGACKLYVPTAFTPNGDGLNDVFKAAYGENITKFRMTVYNRWGEKVFESSDINKGWDGTYSGKILSGVFVWMIQYDTIDSKSQLMKGTVILIR